MGGKTMKSDLDANKIYMDYFLKKREALCELITYYQKQNKTIALWGAGKKGSAFLEVIDPEHNKIDCVFDKDVNKLGMQFCTGHVVEDYRIRTADVVLVANRAYELAVIHIISEYTPKTIVINVDNVVLGDLSASDVINHNDENFIKVRENKICAVVVLYHPDLEVVSNIKSYQHEVDWIYFYDNSTDENTDVLEELKKIPNSTIICKHDNMGLSRAFNEVAPMAREKGYTWMITFDQDSIAATGMIAAMREYVNSNRCDEKIAIVAPVVNDIDNQKETPEVYCSYYDKVIQSGAMHQLSIMEQVGGYDEGLFIYEVDTEYCIRCIINGFKIVKLNGALLMHNQQDEQVEKKFIEGMKLMLNKYSPDAYYYMFRNALYSFNKYKDIYPLHALDCQNAIKKLNVLVRYDVNPEEHIAAMQQAQEDYEKGIMGKRGKHN